MGELAEVAFVGAATGGGSDRAVALARAAMTGERADLGEDIMTTVMLMRVLLHLLDFSTFVGDVPEWELYVELLRYVEEAGLGCFD